MKTRINRIISYKEFSNIHFLNINFIIAMQITMHCLSKQQQESIFQDKDGALKNTRPDIVTSDSKGGQTRLVW